SAKVIDCFLSRISFMLISRLSPMTILRAEARLFRSSAVPSTMRRCILRPSAPGSRHLKHHTSGPRLRLSMLTLPSCISLLLLLNELWGSETGICYEDRFVVANDCCLAAAVLCAPTLHDDGSHSALGNNGGGPVSPYSLAAWPISSAVGYFI